MFEWQKHLDRTERECRYDFLLHPDPHDREDIITKRILGDDCDAIDDWYPLTSIQVKKRGSNWVSRGSEDGQLTYFLSPYEISSRE